MNILDGEDIMPYIVLIHAMSSMDGISVAITFVFITILLIGSFIGALKWSEYMDKHFPE
jgi:hypothetical protein